MQITDEETLYALAGREMRKYIAIYLNLIRQTKGLNMLTEEAFKDKEAKILLLSGIDSALSPNESSSTDIIQEWERRKAIPFDIEQAVTRGVYIELREKVKKMVGKLAEQTNSFSSFDANFIKNNPFYLPFFQRLANLSSKAQLKSKIGSASDNKISKSASEKLVNILNSLGKTMSSNELILSIEPTLEGIVRDLVGNSY